MPDDQHTNFSAWLNEKMNAANLTSTERKELMDWLNKRQELPAPARDEDKIDTGDVLEFVGWLGARLQDAFIPDSEREQLFDWLFQRLRSESSLNEDDMDKIKESIKTHQKS